jgi:hypothetical protein
MSITPRQKQIVNPYAAGYDYDARRNRFVIDAIHEKYLYFFQYPEIGEALNVSPSDNIENAIIQREDIEAYFALYPQNGTISDDKAVEISHDEQINQLRLIAAALQADGQLGKYSSKTSEVSYLPEFEENQDVANLIAIPPAHSQAYKNKLRLALSLPKHQYSSDVSLNNIPLTPQVSTYIISDANVDLYDWRENCFPGASENVYYNSIDLKYYYTNRTDEADIDYMGDYEFNTMRMESISGSGEPRWLELPESGKSLYTGIVQTALEQILLASGKYSQENYGKLVEKYMPPGRYPLYNRLESRPGSRWIYAVKIDSGDVDSLPDAESLEPSREESELSSLAKAKILISSANKSSRRIQFLVEDGLRYLAVTRDVLKGYDNAVFDIGIRDLIGGIDFSRETGNLRSFMSLLTLFCNYNKIALLDSDRVEMFFTEDYKLDHIVINGSFYYQATGTRTYLDPETEYARVLNAFSILTPTTFSLIESMRRIYELGKTTATENYPNALAFMTEYMYPKPDLEKIKNKQAKMAELEREQRAQKNKVFETYKRITQGNPRDFEFMYSNRPAWYTLNSTLQNMDCDSGQAAVIGYGLKFWQAAMGKTRIQSVIRQVIILLRDEVVEDETNKRYLTQGAGYVQDPGRVTRDIENYVNQQIYCSLDVLGDFLEDQFLDPLGLPPPSSTLSRTTIDTLPAIEFKKCEMVGLMPTQSQIYQKMIEVVLLNFVKSIAAGVAKDFIRALLGCGPNDPEVELANPFRKEDYGFINLLEYVEELDLVGIADLVGLKDTSNELSRDVNLAQISAFVKDVSLMSTPVELQQLLTGDASYDLLIHLNETVTGDDEVEIIETEVVDLNSEEWFRRTRGLDDTEVVTKVVDTIIPSVYNSINFTTDNIKLFFITVGAAMQGALDDLGDAGFNSPLEAFCSKKDGFVNPLTLNLSAPEIEAQYNEIVNSKIAKINSLCGFLRDLTNIELQLARLLENLPMLDYYSDLLQDIADLSNAFAAWVAKKFLALFGQEQTTVQGTEYNLYNSKMGTELFYQIFWGLREVLINQLYFSGFARGTQYFITPSSFSGERIGYSVTTAGEDDWFQNPDSWNVQGNFGARKNAYTQDYVYKYIWSDSRTGTYVSPPRLDLPQYRHPEVVHVDSRDAAYYSIPNSPPPLRKDLAFYLTPINLGEIAYGSKRVTEAESGVLRSISQKTFDYLQKVETHSPYTGFTGATYLRCANASGGDIRTFYANRPYTFPMLSYYQPEAGLYHEVSSSLPPSQRGNYEAIDYRIYNGTTYSSGNFDHYIRTVPIPGDDPRSQKNILEVGGVLMPPMYTSAYIHLYQGLSIGVLPQQFGGPPGEWQLGVPIGERRKDVQVIQNYTTRIDSLINNSVINEIGTRRMPRYISSLNRPALQISDDICITPEERHRAEVALKKIQTKMGTFFLNIMPMAQAYPNWRSVGTVETITDYLHRELLEDLESKDLLGPFSTLIPDLKKVYPHDDTDPDFINNPLILSRHTAKHNLKSIVRCVYVGMLNNIATYSEYNQVNLSVFDPNGSGLGKYKSLLATMYDRFRRSPSTYLSQIQKDRQNGLGEFNGLITQLVTGRGRDSLKVTDLGLMVGTYYFPIAFQIASYMMYMDKGIRFAERYSDIAYRLVLEEAAIDDSVLSAVKGQAVTKFLSRYSGFPVVVDNHLQMHPSLIQIDSAYNITYERDQFDTVALSITYYNQEEAEKRIQNLQNLLDNRAQRVDWRQSMGLLSYADQIPFFERDESGKYSYPTYLGAIMTHALKAYVDRYTNETRELDFWGFTNKLHWIADDGRSAVRFTVDDFKNIVNNDNFTLDRLFRLAADLTATDPGHPHGRLTRVANNGNFNFNHIIDGHREIGRNQDGPPVPLSYLPRDHEEYDSQPRPAWHRFFEDYVNFHRGRTPEDWIWPELIEEGYEEFTDGLTLTPAGLWLGSWIFESGVRPDLVPHIREEKRILEILIKNDE